MAKFKVVVSDPETGKAKTVEIEGSRTVPFIGRKIGDVVDGSLIGLSGHKIMIMGGSDRDGFPMRPDIHGGAKMRVILSGGTGFKPREKGKRRRKTVRGNVITEDIFQINVKIVEKPEAEKARQDEPT